LKWNAFSEQRFEHYGASFVITMALHQLMMKIILILAPVNLESSFSG
jgi:hypothetical protein